MDKPATIILNQTQINHRIRRIAYQIYESNVNESEIILAGILKNGFELAQRLKEELQKISELQITLCEVRINKRQPLDPVQTSIPSEEYKGKSLVLVDDVLHSGTT